MTAPHYYASTSGILVDRFLKYGLFSFAYGGGIAIFRDHDKATKWAQAACFAGAAALTTTFFGLESQVIDNSVRNAVSASMGVDPGKIEFTDYLHCNNVIAREGCAELIRLQKWRYGTDALFLLPTIVEAAYGKYAGKKYNRQGGFFPDGNGTHALPPTKDVIAKPNNYPSSVHLLAGHNGWAMSTYAGKAAYWVYETFFVEKTAYYNVVKLRENLEATGNDIGANDLKAIYQRARTDRKLPMVSLTSREQNDALRVLFTRMADEYNKHDGKFGIDEIVYLIGENKINIHAADNRTFSQAAVEQSHREIDKVLAIGLKGIREENRQRRIQSHAPGIHDKFGRKSFVENLANNTVSGVQGILNTIRRTPRRPEEYVSERDPTNIMSLNGVQR